MYVLLSKLLVQALAQSAFRKLPRGKDASDDIAPPAGSRSREEQCSSLPEVVQRILLECQNDLA